MSFIEKLRNRSERERRRLALVFSVIFTVLIVVIWVVAVAFGWSDFRLSFKFSVPEDLKEKLSSAKEQVIGLYPQNGASTTIDSLFVSTSTATSTVSGEASVNVESGIR